MHSAAVHFAVMHSAAVHCAVMHSAEVHCAVMHSASVHSAVMHSAAVGSAKCLRIEKAFNWQHRSAVSPMSPHDAASCLQYLNVWTKKHAPRKGTRPWKLYIFPLDFRIGAVFRQVESASEPTAAVGPGLLPHCTLHHHTTHLRLLPLPLPLLLPLPVPLLLPLPLPLPVPLPLPLPVLLLSCVHQYKHRRGCAVLSSKRRQATNSPNYSGAVGLCPG